jgi:hypothetical protein
MISAFLSSDLFIGFKPLKISSSVAVAKVKLLMALATFTVLSDF